jgi:hypothetical protein
MARWVAPIPEQRATPDDYEAALSPIYAWMHQLTQRSGHVTRKSAGASARAWSTLAGSGRRRRRLRAALLGAGYGLAVAALNRIGLGPLERSLSGPSLRRGTLHGFKESLRRLGVDAPYVIWGHSHRSGPWPDDDQSEWITHAGGRILNTGSWTYARHFVAGTRPDGNPYFPGTAVIVEADGPPRLVRLLEALDPA